MMMRCKSSGNHLWVQLRFFCNKSSYPLHICIVGSGPAGFYTADKLMKRFGQAKVNMLERLPTPFGLVRSGVAPDHPETKVVVNQFSRVAASDRFSLIGNVSLGKDVSVEDLRKLYHVVVFAYGAESDRELGIKGEDLKGVHSAREFVWWYNGHPDGLKLTLDLERTDTAVILGQGNVALDAARILLRPTEDLMQTDIAEHALAALRRSQVRKVFLVGRRGPVQAACTAKELREILGIKGLNVFVQEADLVTSPADMEEMKLNRSHKRVYELFTKAAMKSLSESVGNEKELHFVFFRAPSAILPCDDKVHVGGVSLEKTTLQGQIINGQQLAVGTGVFEELACGLVLKSIGYKSKLVAGLPFDLKKGVIPNFQGRVLNDEAQNSKYEKGLYVVGWLKRGPTGIIGTNMICAEEVVESIAQDLEQGLLTSFLDVPGYFGLLELLQDKAIQFLSFDDWQKINQEEIRRGELKGKIREKIVRTEEQLEVARKVRV
ncbi:hypothetical protein O6H91_12G104900 [Diphasiastrum complanatum]|uniref:Uncharacterized protein n=3 Tax=Diphasiastrum complanatum TaxID=34168 RepID=A0ACC2C5T2_DIPCM|nr:hypothetical protein O6H91_12G104900 [Diphasiastrum complanatum]KAJ7537248.1 hypothetical protein O6H91_12G104900 [Diphasiastrum complanatum]KAJ7537249.1 hypothetical protein O6H91_12G104900 [Diphasiastrum complanatum]